jgi:acyl carrier protein
MTSAVFERVRGIAADVLQVPEARITPEARPATIEGWDSVQHLNLILALEDAFGVQFAPEEIEEMTSIDGIVSAIDARGASRL